MSRSGKKLTTEQKNYNRKSRNKLRNRRSKHTDRVLYVAATALSRNCKAKGYEELLDVIIIYITQFFKSHKHVKLNINTGKTKTELRRYISYAGLIECLGHRASIRITKIQLKDDNLTISAVVDTATSTLSIRNILWTPNKPESPVLYFSGSISNPSMLNELNKFLTHAKNLYNSIESQSRWIS